MKKIVFLLFMFFLTGCSVSYDLEIRNEKIREKNSVFNTNTINSSNLNKNYNLTFYSDSVNITDTTSEEELKKMEKYNIDTHDHDIVFKYDFNIDNYYDSNAANTCYDYFKVNKNGDIVTISTSNSFNCFNYYKELEKVTVNITSHYGVVQSNSDKVNGKKHTWEITPDNAENKPIIFVYDESKKNITLLDYIKENYILFIIIGIFTIGVPIFLLIRIRSKKVNKI